MRKILIIGGSSDIGHGLIDQYLTSGAKVIATYRNKDHMEVIKNKNRKNLTLMPLHIGNYIQRYSVYEYLTKTKFKWDTVIFLNATTKPIGPFMEVDVNRWEENILSNSLAPIRFLQKLYEAKCKGVCNVCFFGGGGVNGTFDSYSAYTLSKVILMKMCEILDSEYKDINPFLIGPSFVKTKIHQETLSTCDPSGIEYRNVQKFLKSGPGTPLTDIYSCIEWCCDQGKEVVGGRNIAVKHDLWKESGDILATTLKKSPDMFKLRRSV